MNKKRQWHYSKYAAITSASHLLLFKCSSVGSIKVWRQNSSMPASYLPIDNDEQAAANLRRWSIEKGYRDADDFVLVGNHQARKLIHAFTGTLVWHQEMSMTNWSKWHSSRFTFQPKPRICSWDWAVASRWEWRASNCLSHSPRESLETHPYSLPR